MATKRQVTLRFRDEYMKASKKDKGRILDEMCSVLAIGRSTARRRVIENGVVAVSAVTPLLPGLAGLRGLVGSLYSR